MARLQDEVFGLITETAACLGAETGRTSRRAGGVMIVETTRLTARLTDMAAWVLGRRAVECGEIDLDTWRSRYALEAGRVHLAPLSEPDGRALPPRICSLLERSLSLYKRLMRLSGVQRPERAMFPARPEAEPDR